MVTASNFTALRDGRFSDYRDLHRGETIVVCGCGESLKLLQARQRFVTIGVNDVGRHFTPDYLVVVNPRAQFSEDRFAYVQNSQSKVLFTQYTVLGVAHPCVVNFSLGTYGGTDLSNPDVLHYTQNSPYVALCLAAHMGARRVGLIGVDFTENHFFGRTGVHPLASHLSIIDDQYRRLGAALSTRGIEVFNLSPNSRLTAFPKITVQDFAAATSAPNSDDHSLLKIVSYATTPIAGVPLALAQCISARTPHRASCVWSTNDYGNGVRFESAIEWKQHPDLAEARLREADLVIVHNGKVEPRHRSLLERKPLLTMAHNYMWNVDRTLVDKGFPGAVVGQYQATLREFDGWELVPNPLPFWESAYRADGKPDIVTICYTPSGTHESYPREHRLYWHSKGYETTLRALDRLSQRHKIHLETIRAGQVSHAESLAMKRRAHIVIDECVTGSYHRNSLEGLACGCIVVNGVGLLPGVAEAFCRCAPSTATIPFVPANLENLESVLNDLIEAGPEALTARGLENRSWLERNWDFARQWSQHWDPLVRRAQTVAGGAPSLFVAGQPTGAQAVAPQVPTTSELRPGISVVIPHGGVERLAHLGASLANLAQARGVSEVIVVEMGGQSCAERLARRWQAKYVFIRNPEVFERARALNTGAALAEFDLVLWKDNDLLLPESFAEIAAAELRSRNLDHLLPYEAIRYLNAADSRSVIAGTVAPATCKPARVLYGGRDVSGGAALVRSDFLLRCGGIPEMFRGWGGEDNAWTHKASLFGRTGVTQRSGQYLFHLHHADSGAFAGRPLSTNPYYSENVAMLGRLRAIASKEEFLRRFPDSGRGICPWDKSRRIALLYAPSASAAAATVERGLRSAYGIGCAARSLPHDWILECADAEAIIVIDAPEAFLREADAEGLWARILVLVTDRGAMAAAQRSLLARARATVVLDTAVKPGEGAWAISAAQLNDPIGLAKVLVQPLSLLMAGDKTRARQSGENLAGGELPVWVYWEGECPEWVRLCQQTIRRHAPGLRLLDRAAFETLWDIDRDINLQRLQTAHRSDFVRAFLLARFGGLWIDSDCIVMQPLTEIFASLRENDFVAHRDRQGFYPNGFIGARPNSIIAAELYQRVCERLRAGRPLGWISLGGEPLTEVLRTTAIKWRELPCETIQPICWSHPEVFFEIGSAHEHELKRDPSVLCYMLSNTEVQKFVAKNPEQKILAEGTFFRYLIKRSLETNAEDGRVPVLTSPLRVARETAALLETISKLQPRRILEIGVGTGFRGLLIRESYKDRESDIFELAGVRPNGAVKLTVREDVYTSILQEPLDRIHLLDSKSWDLVMVGSGWEPATELAIQCLKTALEKSAYVLLFGSDVSRELTASLVAFSDDLVCAMPADEGQATGPRHFLFSRNDPKHVARRHRIGSIFEQIFHDNCRRGDESVSGPGSCLAQTHEIRQRLPFLFADLGIETLLDAGCGDFHWLQHVDLGLKEYIGIDIVGDLIARNRQQFGLPNRRFILADLTEAPLPRSDLILCRDCLVHFSFADIVRILRNFGRSHSMYLLTTTFPQRAENQEIAIGDWRTLNLERAPFYFPAPMRIINERCTERGGIYADKSLGLWRLADLCL